MPVIIGVKFRNLGKVYYFDPLDYSIRYHDHVIVETARGIEYGTVVLSPTEIAEDKVTLPLKPVIRMATEDDDERERTNREKEKEAYQICKKKIAEHGLEMKLIEAEYTFDNSKVLFYFTADGRIDFRDLVKDLASIFRTRIELRQIGVRDETKLLGGIGSCGRPLCCHTWLTDFAPVSIKMAKDQNLSLNPTKISGICGRLMCCLKNEADTYAYLNKGMPGKGDYVTTPDGLHGDVQSVNILRQSVKVVVDLGNDEKELREFDVKDITFIPKSKRPRNAQPGAPKERGKSEGRKAEAKPLRGRRNDGTDRKTDEAAPLKEDTRRRRRPVRPEEGTPEIRTDAADGGARPEGCAADPAESAMQDPEHRKRRRRRRRKGSKPEGAVQEAVGYTENTAGRPAETAARSQEEAPRKAAAQSTEGAVKKPEAAVPVQPEPNDSHAG